MRATPAEFRNRFFIVVGIYALGFAAYAVDPVNAGRSLARLIGRPGAPGIRIVFGIGTAVTVLAGALRTWAAAYLESDVVHDLDLHSDRLIADGPYRRVRNPLYIGMILMGVGIGLFASRLGFVVIVAGLVAFSLRLIAGEEARLAESGGAAFADFRRKVPKLIPSISPRIPASGKRPRWGQAVAGEGFYWAVSLAMIAFVATLDERIFEWTALSALGVYALYQFALRARDRRRQSL